LLTDNKAILDGVSVFDLELGPHEFGFAGPSRRMWYFRE
jgi:hypothetical protein